MSAWVLQHPNGVFIRVKEAKVGDLWVLRKDHRIEIVRLKEGLYGRVGVYTKDGAYQTLHPEDEIEVVRGLGWITTRFDRGDVV